MLLCNVLSQAALNMLKALLAHLRGEERPMHLHRAAVHNSALQPSAIVWRRLCEPASTLLGVPR